MPARTMKILLLDLDGVLLESGGYHRALQATVARIACLLGYPAVSVSAEDIVAFEAAGVFSEWDSSAICAALLLKNLWDEYPTLALPRDPTRQVLPDHGRRPPNFRGFAAALAQFRRPGMSPLERAERVLLSAEDGFTPTQREILQEILHNARQLEGSLTHCIFQELVLGSQVFAASYGVPGLLDSESFLLRYDRIKLSDWVRDELLTWLQDAQHGAAIFTSRPSRGPVDGISTPEGEMGARVVGLETVPLLGLGGLLWLSARYQRSPQFFLKPAPAHSLAALRRALEDPLVVALEAAAALVLERRLGAGWHRLQGAEIIVFEDTTPGLESIETAHEILAQAGVMVTVRRLGISDRPEKRAALRETGAEVMPDLGAALAHVPGFWQERG